MSIDKALVAARFARAAGTYDAEAAVQRYVARQLLRFVASHVDRPVRSVVEVGCGTGCLTRQILARFRPRRMVLNDLCPAMGERLVGLAPGIDFVPGDAETCTFGHGFDLAVSSSVMQWFVDPGAFFSRSHGMLNDGGVLAFSAYGPENMHQIGSVTGIGLAYKTLDDWTALLDSGWRVIVTEEETIDTTFASPLAVLRHLKHTGVTGVGRYQWTARKLREFESEYRRRYADESNVTLTYHPLYIVAVKSGRCVPGRVTP